MKDLSSCCCVCGSTDVYEIYMSISEGDEYKLGRCYEHTRKFDSDDKDARILELEGMLDSQRILMEKGVKGVLSYLEGTSKIGMLLSNPIRVIRGYLKEWV